MPETPTGSLPGWVQWIITAAGGALITLVAFRTRFVVLEGRVGDAEKRMEERRVAHDADMKAVQDQIDKRLGTIERRQMMTLQVIADIAKKVGVDGRMGDTLMHFLAEEAKG